MPDPLGVPAALRAALEAAGVAADVVVTRDYDALRRAVAGRAVDAAWAPPVVCAWLEGAGHTVVARAVRRGTSTTASALVGRPGTRLVPRTLRAAWVDPWSTVGHLLPRAHLYRRRRVGDGFFVAEEFHGSYDRAVQAVVRGEADVAGVHALPGDPASVTRALERHVPGSAAALVVLDTTDAVPGDGVVVARDVDGAAVWRALQAVPASLLAQAFHVDALERATAGGYRALQALLPGDD